MNLGLRGKEAQALSGAAINFCPDSEPRVDKTPSFSYIIDNYLKNNKPTSKYEYLAVLSSKCAYDNDFRDNLIKNEIDTSKENYFSIGKSTILDSLSKCHGFLRFQKELSKPFSIDMSKIDTTNIRKR